MPRSRRAPALLLLLLLVSIAPAPDAQAQVEARVDSAMHYNRILADPDLFAGRKSGIAKGDSAFVWMARQFERWGLEPLLGSSLLLPYEQLVTEEQAGSLGLMDSPRYGNIEFLLGDDFTLCTNSGSATLNAPVVLVGYGISAADKGWDDYADVDVEGKIVVIVRGRPAVEGDWSEEFSRSWTFPLAVRRGAAAVLYYDQDYPIQGAAISEKAYDPGTPALYIGERVMRHLLEFSGWTVASYKKALKSKPTPLELDRTLKLHTKLQKIELGQAYNVAGVVPGSDPDLASEAVLIGAHADHAGANALGHVYAGANDNGSGASIILELARAYARHPQKRTVVFALFGGEEQGLLGSKALAQSLPDSLSWVNMVNLDMAGYGEGQINLGGVAMLGDRFYPWFEALADSAKDRFHALGRPWGGFSSDFAWFREEGIPYFTGSSHGSHLFYHRPDDRSQFIESQSIGGVLRGFSGWIEFIANDPAPFDHELLDTRILMSSNAALESVKAESMVAADAVSEANRRIQTGARASLLSWSLPKKPAQRSELAARLKEVVRQIAAQPLLAHEPSFSGIQRRAWRQPGKALLGLRVKQLQQGDDASLALLGIAGASVLELESASILVDRKGALRKEFREFTLPLLEQQEWVLMLPISQVAGLLDAMDELPIPVLASGPYEAFVRLPGELQQRMLDSDLRLLLTVDPALPLPAEQQQRLAEAGVQLQPRLSESGAEGFRQRLRWTAGLSEQAGSQDDAANTLIGGALEGW